MSVNPADLSAGTYTGNVTVASTGASNSPQSVSVTFTVTSSAQPSLAVSPASPSFSASTGGTAPAAQDITVKSTGAALNYTITSTKSATWLSATPASDATPGTIRVAANPAGLVAGTYQGSVSIASTGAANTPQTVPVTLTVSGAGEATLDAMPRSPRFTSQVNGSHPHSQSLNVSSTRTALHFTAKVLGATWLSVTPSAGSALGKLTVSVDSGDLVPGHYCAVIDRTSAPGADSTYVPVMLMVETGSGDGDHDSDDRTIMAGIYTYDPGNTGGVAAQWVSGAGVPSDDPSDPTNEGLLLTNNVPASSYARAGVLFANVEGITLTALGFDIRQASLCTAQGPHFIVQTRTG